MMVVADMTRLLEMTMWMGWWQPTMTRIKTAGVMGSSLRLESWGRVAEKRADERTTAPMQLRQRRMKKKKKKSNEPTTTMTMVTATTNHRQTTYKQTNQQQTQQLKKKWCGVKSERSNWPRIVTVSQGRVRWTQTQKM
jgi:hypothetical protein